MEAADRYVAGYLAQRKRLPFLAKGRCGRPDRHPDLARRLACGQPAGRRCPHVRASGSRRGRSRNRGPERSQRCSLWRADPPIGAVIEGNHLRSRALKDLRRLPGPRRRDLGPLRLDGHAESVRRRGRQSTQWTLSAVAGQFLRSPRTRPSTLPSPWPSSEARWLDRHLTMYGQELTDGGRGANASHRRQIPLGPGRVPRRPRR